MPRVTVQVPPRPPAPGPSNPASISGPYMTQILQPFPTGDGTTWVFGIYGLSEADVVEWEVTLGEFDFVPNDVLDAHTLLVVYMGGDGGTVTAAVNGTALDTVSYGAPP